jgi:hypothetical protein
VDDIAIRNAGINSKPEHASRVTGSAAKPANFLVSISIA